MNGALKFPGLSERETLILQLRAREHNYRVIAQITGIAPRKIHDLEKAALRKVVRYLEQQAFLKLE